MELFTPPPNPGALRQAARLSEDDAELIERLVSVPQAAWFTGGSPAEVRAAVTALVDRAAALGQVAVLAAYDVPGRDAEQYSAGGAADTAAYLAWVDAFADGIGGRRAIVVLEPDSLGLLPDAPDERFAQLRGAAERLAALPRARTYLDGTHSAWLDVDEAAERLLAAGVGHARGFALNVSNFRPTAELVAYGTRLSERLDGACFVVDTSRNGLGPWDGGDEAWCNPPGRGAGARPTTDTGVPRLDALLWVKVPGESDGVCRGGPPAGEWFPERALELARNAVPPLA